MIHRGKALFVEEAPIDEWEGVAEELFEPLEKKGQKVYAYVEFPSLQRAEVGFLITEGGPEDSIVDHTDVTTIYEDESIAPLIDFGDALKELEKVRSGLIEDFPFVEIEKEEDYNELLLASLRRAENPYMFWSDEDLLEESLWTEAGVYDLRDRPPSHHASVEDYELEAMEAHADGAVEWLFQGKGQRETVMPLEVLLERQEEAA